MAKTKGHRGKKAATLTRPELDLALKKDMICSLERKYCLIYCLWVNSLIFLLMQNPGINLTSKERWFSLLTVEEGVKTEIYGFMPKKLHPLMAYNTFSIHLESVSEVKVNTSVIFKPLNPEYFIRGFACNEAAECCELVLGNGGKYTKFTPILYPDPKNCLLNSMDFLKTPVLIKILKVCLFGHASLSELHAPGPQTKAQIWEL
ncbi:hypothetical protein JVU11DRAFT_9453 [Chiua virens]|nr:hypothetical protein JVU11DRAFT_9453 [Chiua virens]